MTATPAPAWDRRWTAVRPRKKSRSRKKVPVLIVNREAHLSPFQKWAVSALLEE